MEEINKIFYNAQGVLSYKRLYNFIMGVRGHGKTYYWTKKCIDCGLETKKKSFVVMVRYKEDIKVIKNDWWTIVEHLYPEWKFSCQGNLIYAQNELERFVIGEYVSLYEYARAKKVPRPYVKYIFFDECLNEDNDYLPNEITKFCSVCDSVIRNRDDVRVILVANTISIINPYFDYFGFTRFQDRFTKGEHNSILEFTDSDKFQEFRATTKFGSSIQGTSYGNFALKGEFMLDDTTNVMKPKAKCSYLFSLVLEQVNVDVSMSGGMLYFSTNKDFTKRMYSPYVESAKNSGAVFCDKNFRHFKVLTRYFLANRVMYETLKIKNEIILFVQFLMGNRYK